MMTTVPVITIDGPSGSGKGTLCKAMTKMLRWNILDSGSIYRVLALAASHSHIDIASEEALSLLAVHLDMEFTSTGDNFFIKLKGKDVSSEIYDQEVANIASQIAIFPRVREILLLRQRAFREAPGLIANGRDMGSVVFPDAQVKIFLDASLEKRAQRRMLQLQQKGFSVTFNYLFSEIKTRDNRDRNRIFSPLFPTKDSLVIDSTSLTIEQTIEKALEYACQKLTFV